jgi:hypothetical protein
MPKDQTNLDLPRGDKRRGSVFISYTGEKLKKAENLSQRISALGFDVWWDHKIQGGEIWNDKLHEAMGTAGCIVVLWSKSAINSPWIMLEASVAMARRVYAPAIIEDVRPKEPFDRTQATNLVDWDGDTSHPGFHDLIRQINNLLPPPKTLWQRLQGWLRAYGMTLLAVIFAISSMGILAWQTRTSARQSRQVQDVLNTLEGQTETSAHQMSVLAKLATTFTEQAANATPFRMMWLVFYFDDQIAEADLDSRSDIDFELSLSGPNRTEMRVQAWPGDHKEERSATHPDIQVPNVQFFGEDHAQVVGLGRHALSVIGRREQKVFGYKTASFWVRLNRRDLVSTPFVHSQTNWVPGENLGKVEKRQMPPGSLLWPFSTMGDFRKIDLHVCALGKRARQLRAAVLCFNDESFAVTIPMKPVTEGDPSLRPDQSLGEIRDLFQSWYAASGRNYPSVR